MGERTPKLAIKTEQKVVCPVCLKPKNKLTNRHPISRVLVCSNCFKKLTNFKPKLRRGVCSLCGKGPRLIHYKNESCGRCYRNRIAKERFPSCSECGTVISRAKRIHPDTKAVLCLKCYFKASGTYDPIGRCFLCKRDQMRLPMLDSESKERICMRCYSKGKGPKYGHRWGKCSKCGNSPRLIYGKALDYCLTCYRKHLNYEQPRY